ncbi:phosphotransferase family protein [Methylopila sp. Yamaguchi]|uniref:phosphotransferase family protein n=1 Tax=Methylopila sp. Yamaguchi TaxID=1437817 RepID=UPI000CBCE1D5|nr:aminoglycoside phosphotransferase family protein [Methylopila sp. Yamaguchi]GBD48253.1 aminoglycoside phosphotransferase [Methylopila sp. Yamaguchi]
MDLSEWFGRRGGQTRLEIGRGTQAVIYRLPDGRIEKAFHDDVPDDLIERERRNARLAYEAGVPTWRVDEPAGPSAGRSVVGSFEAGRPLSSTLRWRPHRALPLIRRMARLHAQIHATPPDARFDKKSVSAEGALRRLRRLAPEADFDRVPQLIGASERGFCHGDLSPSNVLWDGQRLLVLDWARSGFGALTADAGRTAAIIFSSRRIGTPAPAPLGRAYRRLLATEYMAAYCAETGRSLDEVRAWAAVFLESKATSAPYVARRAGLTAEIVRLVQPAAAGR